MKEKIRRARWRAQEALGTLTNPTLLKEEQTTYNFQLPNPPLPLRSCNRLHPLQFLARKAGILYFLLESLICLRTNSDKFYYCILKQKRAKKCNFAKNFKNQDRRIFAFSLHFSRVYTPNSALKKKFSRKKSKIHNFFRKQNCDFREKSNLPPFKIHKKILKKS